MSKFSVQPRANPKRLADPAAVRDREAKLREPHMADLTFLVERIRKARGGGNSVPWFDPESGGRHAEVLLMFEAPGARAVGPGAVRPSRPGSGFISPDNNDESAAAVLVFEQAAGLERERLLHWNIVPWYVGDGTRIRAVNKADLTEASKWLAELLDLLTNLRVLVLCGEAAQAGWDAYTGRRPEHLRVLACPHPSPVNLRTRPDASAEILAAFTEATWIIDPPHCPTCGSRGLLIVYGMPDLELQRAAERGDVLIGGCIVDDDNPTHGCEAGHEWQQSQPEVMPPATTSTKPSRPRPPGMRSRTHAAPHPDAVFDGPLTEAQGSAQRVLRELVANSPSGSIRVGHLSALTEVFDEWGRDHAERRDGSWFFTGKGGTGLWHVLQGLCPLEDPTRWNGLRAAIVAQLEGAGRWRRVRPPRGATFELLDSRPHG